MEWPTAQNVVSQAALELGLIQSAGDLTDDVYATTDSNITQLLALLKKSGREILDDFQWEQLRAEWSITTLGNLLHPRIGAYPMPPDFAAMIDQSGWNRTQRVPMGGPLSEQEWQYLASRMTGVVWTVLFRPMQGLMWLYPATSTPPDQQITFGYKSRNWVRPSTLVEGTDFGVWAPDFDFNIGALVGNEVTASLPLPFLRHIYRCVQPGLTDAAGVGPDAALTSTGQPTVSGSIVDGACYWNYLGSIIQSVTADNNTAIETPTFATKSAPTAGSDVLLFDEQLLVAKLKLAWREAKGFDTTDAQDDFDAAWERATSNSNSAPILSLNRGATVRGDRLLSGLNVPITGFGE